MILGLDVSTSCVGWARVDNKLVIDYGHIRLDRKSQNFDFYDKFQVVQEVLNTFITRSIDKIVIEEILNKFAFGKSSAQTISTLARFNGAISATCYDMFNIKPVHIPFVTARKVLGIKKIIKTQDMKEVVHTWVRANVTNYIDKITSRNNICKQCYDECDAIVIALASEKIV